MPMHAVVSEGSRAFAWGRRHTLVVLMMLAAAVGYSDRVNMSVAAIAMQQHYAWSQTTKGAVLAAFFVGYLAFMVVGGWLASRYGGRRVLGHAVLWWSVWTLLTPLAAGISLPVLIGARIAIGAGEALLFPAIYELASRWSPRNEYTRLIAVTGSGIPLGTVVGLLGTGWLLTRFEWPSAFYVFGAIGLAWCVVWFATARDRPDDDPRVSPEERRLLAEVEKQELATPAKGSLRNVLLHRSALALYVAHFANTWTLYVLLSWLPSYLREVQHMSIGSAGVWSAGPWASMFVMMYAGAGVAEFIIRRTGSVASARKLLQAVGLLGSGALLLSVSVLPPSPPIVLAVLCAATGLLGLGWSGFSANYLDVSPRHSAMLFGVGNTFGTIPGVVGVTITGWLIDVSGTYTAAFALAAAVSVAGTTVFALFGRGTPIEARPAS
jgi:ACS family sodium-dependent inorganic phosphate cotransporter